jgi:chromosome segregation ATPase
MPEEVREVKEVRAPFWEAEAPWMVAYLREDIQDLRNEMREVRRSVQRLNEKLDSGLERLDEKIDGGLERLDAKIDARTDGLDAKIDGRSHELRQEIGKLHQTMNVQFRWMLTTMVAVGALIVAILELLRF